MSQSGRINVWMAIAIVCTVALVGVVAMFVIADYNTAPANAGTTNISYQADKMSAKTDDQKVVRALLLKKGWKEDQINFGKIKGHIKDRGAGSFSFNSLLTEQELVGYLNSHEKRAASVRKNLKSYAKESGYGSDEVKRMLAGGHWVRVQFLAPFQWTGMTYYRNGHLVVSMSPRKVMKGDIGWFYVTSNHKVLPGRTVVRGDCSNPALVPSPPPPGFKPPTTLAPKNWKKFPHEPKPQKSKTPSPIGTMTTAPRPADPDPTPCGPVEPVNPKPTPTPDSGSGATVTTSPTAQPTQPPAPGPTGDPTPPPGDPGMP